MDSTVQPGATSQQPISDDQELAKVLAGINQQVDEDVTDTTDDMGVPPLTDDAAAPAAEPVAEPASEPELTVPPVVEQPAPEPVVPDMTAVEPPVSETPVVASSSVAASGDLNTVKSDAINELRPLVDKLNVPAEEKFDTYLLLLRSTDDRSLIEPAHEIAKQITDEARRAQALLDIIKEIDFLSGHSQQA